MNATLRHLRCDDGTATVQAVLTVPLLGLLVFTIVQFALYFHAVQIAQMTADQGLDAARTVGATNADGQARADSYLAVLGHGVLHDGHARITRTDSEVQATVTGNAEQVVPFLHLAIDVSAAGPIERIGER